MGSQLLVLSFHIALNKVKPKQIVLFVTAARSLFFSVRTPHSTHRYCNCNVPWYYGLPYTADKQDV